VHLRLLVARLVVAQAAGVLLQCLADTGDVAVPEDAEHAGEERPLDPVPLDPLRREEAHQGLSHGEADRGGGATRHRTASAALTSGTRGSVARPSHDRRIQV
jgi:hypothetical protein